MQHKGKVLKLIKNRDVDFKISKAVLFLNLPGSRLQLCTALWKLKLEADCRVGWEWELESCSSEP